jgi:hypothetical protein
VKRRQFITLIGGAAAAWPLAARAQKSPEMRPSCDRPPIKPGDYLTESGNPRYVAFFKELRHLGYVEGQNIAVERYSGEGRTGHYADIRERDGAFYRAEAYGFSREYLDYVQYFPIEPDRGSASGRALLEGEWFISPTQRLIRNTP